LDLKINRAVYEGSMTRLRPFWACYDIR